MPHTISKPSNSGNTTEPSLNDAEWRAFRLADERTGEVVICFDVPTTLFGRCMVRVDSDFEDQPAKARLALKRRGAELTGSKKEQIAFVHRLLNNMPREPQILAVKPGFRDGGFILGTRMFGTAAGRYRWLEDPNYPGLGATAGSKAAWDSDVGEILIHSTYASVAVLVQLAACLPRYIQLRMIGSPTLRPLLPEMAVFNLAGESASGKTLASRISAAVIGSPDAIFKWAFTRPAIEKWCESRNDLALILDDTETYTEERDFKQALRWVNQFPATGESKGISDTARTHDNPKRTWSILGITSSPKSLKALADEVGWKRTLGECVRWFDIPIPPRADGGIIDQLSGGDPEKVEKTRELIARLERGISQNYGLIFPLWIEFLLAEDRSKRVIQLVNRFIEKTAPYGDGWDQRFARKFAILYAAGVLAIEANILPWPRKWPAKAVLHCYRRALSEIRTETDIANDALRIILRLSQNRRRLLRRRPGSTHAVEFKANTLGLRYTYNGKQVCALRDDKLVSLAGSTAVAKQMVRSLSASGALLGGQGHARTTQLPVSIKISGQIIKKPRFWLIGLKSLESLVKALKRKS